MTRKRAQAVGTRRLTQRAFLAAWHDRAHNNQIGPFVKGEPEATTRIRGRAIEHHAILHQQRQVYALLVQIAGKTVAEKLARRWTFLAGE